MPSKKVSKFANIPTAIITPTITNVSTQNKPSPTISAQKASNLIGPTYNQIAAQKVITAEKAIHNTIGLSGNAGAQGITGFGKRK